MNKLFALIALGAAVTGSAQVFRPEIVNGAVLGAAAGAVIGHNDGRHGWEGAAYGAAAGALLGAIAGDARETSWDGAARVSAPVRIDVGYGYLRGNRHHHYPRYRRPAAVWWGGYDRGYRRYGYGRYSGDVWARPYGTYAGEGAFWGGLAGAIIGHNDGRHGWEGAGYGALGGWIIGSMIDRDVRRYDPAPRVRRYARDYRVPAIYDGDSAPAVAPQQVTIINNYYAAPTAMSSANGLFGR